MPAKSGRCREHGGERERLVGLDERVAPRRGERPAAAQRRREPLHLADEADAQPEEAHERHRAQRLDLAGGVATREELDGEIERRELALERRGHGRVVAGRDAVGGEHAVRERDEREVELGDLVGRA